MNKRKKLIREKCFLIFLIGFFVLSSCSRGYDGEEIASALGVKDNPSSPFYVNLNELPNPLDKSFIDLPIGIFDSGTGGLTVLEATLKMDEFDNNSLARKKSGDSQPDFINESFVYFGDLANMPYGNYPFAGRSDFLAELSVKDALFLLNTYYHISAGGLERNRKQSVKSIIIACNTATAYGKKCIEEMIYYLGLEVKIIGIIESGAEGAIEIFNNSEGGTVGVMATVGTVLSKSYPKELRKKIKERNYSLKIDVVQEGCFGLAEAIDRESNFIQPVGEYKTTRNDYLGPSLNSKRYKIKLELLPLYNFDENGLLIQKADNGKIVEIQINSVDNYVKYYVTEMIMKIKKQKLRYPLRAIILGCSHYPYIEDEITKHLEFLENYRDSNEEKPFEEYLKDKVYLIDPADLTARKAMEFLINNKLLKSSGKQTCEFYMSVPNRNNKDVELNVDGSFTYDFKYNRKPFYLYPKINLFPPQYVLYVPMIWEIINTEVVKQIQERLPVTYKTLVEFNNIISK